MRFLVIGFFVLLGWSALSIHTYVCKIKGLCNETERRLEPELLPIAAVETDSLVVSLPLLVKEIPDNLVIHFAFDKSEFNSDTAIQIYYDQSKLYLDQNPQSGMIITGFTDAVGTDEYNMELGFRRAQSVKNYFESMSIPAGRLSIASRGENEPADDNATVTGRANNRRALIIIKK